MPHPRSSHLYHQSYRTKSGQKRTLHYIRFRTWQGQLLDIPAGDNETVAIKRRDFLRGLNVHKYDFLIDPENHLGKRKENPSTAETLQKWVDRWFVLKKGKKSLDKDKWNAARLLAFYGGPPGGLLTEITTARVEDYKLFRSGEKMRYGGFPKPATINRELALLRSILRMASDQDALSKLPKVKLLTEHNERHRTATRAEFERLLKALAHRPEVCDMLEVLWEQGLRENEVVGLKWPQVDLERQVFIFPSLSTKEKKPRQPPMSPRTYEILSRRIGEQLITEQGQLSNQLRSKGNSVISYVFTTLKGSPFKPRWFKRLVSKAMVKAGIKGLWVHDLRGTFITRKVIEEGYDRKIVKMVTGHSTDYAFERYLRPSLEHQREMMKGRKREETAIQNQPEAFSVDNSAEEL